MKNYSGTHYPPGSGIVCFRAPLSSNGEREYRVQWAGKLCSPSWALRGPALAYLDMLARGQRAPEYA